MYWWKLVGLPWIISLILCASLLSFSGCASSKPQICIVRVYYIVDDMGRPNPIYAPSVRVKCDSMEVQRKLFQQEAVPED